MADDFKTPKWFALRDGSTLIALHDGLFNARADMIHDLAGEAETSALRSAEGDPTLDVNAFAYRRDGRMVLIDTGTGDAWGPSLGHVARSVTGLGVKAEAIDTVVLTHPHGDHALGLLTAEGRLRYPNAEVFCPGIDIDFFGNDQEREARGEAAAQSFATARKVFEALGSRLRPYAPGEILPGIEAISMPGHTFGHCGLLIGGEMLIVGDVLHMPRRQVPTPTVCTVFDLDPELAVNTRRQVIVMAAEREMKVLGMHTPFGQIGTITGDGDRYRIDFA